MRLISSKNTKFRLQVGQTALIQSEPVRQIATQDSEHGGFALKGRALESAYCQQARVRFVVEFTNTSFTWTSLQYLEAQYQEQTYGLDGDLTVTAPFRNVTGQLLWTQGLYTADLFDAAIARAALQLRNIGTQALPIRVRVEVYDSAPWPVVNGPAGLPPRPVPVALAPPGPLVKPAKQEGVQ